MTDCPYCERSFAEESEIRKHLYEYHESDELGRIDTKRVEQYIDDHDLEESDDDATRAQQDTDEAVGMTAATNRQSDERWELHDVQALSTREITDKLAEHGIDTTEASFRDRAAVVDSAMALVDQWEDDHDVDASGYDQDFIWMAAEVLWSQWAPDVPYRERIYDLVQDGRELREQDDDAEACEQWLSAWEVIVAVTPDDITTIEAADDYLPNVLSLEAFLRSLDNDLATLAADDPTYHDRRLEFCREVCTQFPDAPDEFLLDFRHFVADSLTELGRVTKSRSEFETLIRDYPEDPWAYKKLADSYWREGADEPTAEELERAVKLYEQALNAEGSLEQPATVSDRIGDLERRLADVDTSEAQER
ncbi:tetratricopeptide repeat protein [Halorubrum sp. AD140]|uniref:tetratricopeptide repeat protein n=1 Tax=Halorubrum sp. AD140 TaxID=3050073 RepID=UPI002ACCF0EB|nr:tetratricopeptide repeat protein [Halorubrum sp. AD140]MDZ5812949.1 tetratricopeptide repeat protein [Halorubrum sp. AD140]